VGAATAAEVAPVARTRTARRRRSGWSPKRIAAYVVLVLFAVFYLYPFFIEILASFKDDPQAAASPLSIPHPFDLTAWKRILGFSSDSPVPILRWLGNSLFVTIVVTVSRVFFDSLAGYALSRLKFRGRGFLFNAVLAVMAVPGVALLIPKFLIVRQLGIYDTYSAMILPLLIDAAGVFIMKQFFDTIPVSIEEAARIDGAGAFRTFWSVILPMARPALITLTILSFQGSWNEFAHFVISRQSSDLNTLTTGVASLTSGERGSGNQYPLQLAAAVLMSIPVAVLFFVFQRRIMNTTSGGEKG
jgi:multiple sugar transport system permease protein